VLSLFFGLICVADRFQNKQELRFGLSVVTVRVQYRSECRAQTVRQTHKIR
jgi:hypothetical protein